MICIVLTKDGGVKHFDAHEPVLVSPNMPLNFIIAAPPQPTQNTRVRLRVCQRCGVTYLDGIERDFKEEAAKKPSVPPAPDVH